MSEFVRSIEDIEGEDFGAEEQFGFEGARLIWELTGEDALPETFEEASDLTHLELGLLPQEPEVLQRRVRTGDGIMLIRIDPVTKKEEFVAYQSLPKKYIPFVKSTLAMWLDIYESSLPDILISEWATGFTRSDYQNLGINRKMKHLLELKRVDEQNEIDRLTIGEAWDIIPASLSVNLRKNNMHAVDSTIYPFAAEFLSSLPYIPGQGRKDLTVGEKRLMGDDLRNLEERIKNGEKMPGEEIALRMQEPSLVLMASDLDLVSDIERDLTNAMNKAGKEKIERYEKLMEVKCRDVASSIKERYSSMPGVNVQHILALVGALKMYSLRAQNQGTLSESLFYIKF